MNLIFYPDYSNGYNYYYSIILEKKEKKRDKRVKNWYLIVSRIKMMPYVMTDDKSTSIRYFSSVCSKCCLQKPVGKSKRTYL